MSAFGRFIQDLGSLLVKVYVADRDTSFKSNNIQTAQLDLS